MKTKRVFHIWFVLTLRKNSVSEDLSLLIETSSSILLRAPLIQTRLAYLQCDFFLIL